MPGKFAIFYQVFFLFKFKNLIFNKQEAK